MTINWLLPALISPLMFSMIILFDKYIIEKEIPTFWGIPILSSISAGFFGTVIAAINGFNSLDRIDGILIIAAGMLTSWGTVVYFVGMKAEQSTIVMMMMQMSSVIVLVLSFIFLDERISLNQFIGFCLILFAGILLSVSKGELEKKFQLSKAFWVIMAGDLMWSVSAIIFDYVSVPEKFLTTASYEGWGIGLGGVALYLFIPKIREQFHAILKHHRRGAGFVLVNESFYILTKVVSLLAITLGPVSLVTVIGSTEIFFGLVLASLLSSIAPHIFKEDLSKKTLTKKAWLSLVLFAGLWLVK